MKPNLRGVQLGAALLLFAVVFIGCAKHGYSPAELRAASDSAAIEAPKQIAANSIKHSLAYDSLLRYYRSASEIEHARSAMEEMLASSVAVIASAASLNDTVRHALVAKFEQAVLSSDSLDQSERELLAGCKRSVDTLLRHLSDTSGRAALREYLLRPQLLGPQWRQAYDSLSTASNEVVVNLLSLIDSARGNVIFDSSANTLRFRDLDLTSRYNAYRDSLAHLGMLEDAARKPSGNP